MRFRGRLSCSEMFLPKIARISLDCTSRIRERFKLPYCWSDYAPCCLKPEWIPLYICFVIFVAVKVLLCVSISSYAISAQCFALFCDTMKISMQLTPCTPREALQSHLTSRSTGLISCVKSWCPFLSIVTIDLKRRICPHRSVLTLV